MGRLLGQVAVALVIGIGFVGYQANERYGLTARLESLDSASFPICRSGRRVTCVVDGDTVWLRGEKIRLKGIDAPEVTKPSCRSEARLARKATSRLRKILSTNEWRIVRSGHDRYGRTLARFYIGNTSVGRMLVDERLAQIWRGRKADWC